MKKLCAFVSAVLLISACGGQATKTPPATPGVTSAPARTATSVPPSSSSTTTMTMTATATPIPSPTATSIPPTATATSAPRPRDWWQESTPAEQGLDPQLISQAYQRAAEIRTIYALLVVKNGYLVAEQYFNGHSLHGAHVTASVTKSFTSALIGLALENGFFTSLDQKMLDSFPEYDTPRLDPRKRAITLRHLLQMRAGYPFDSNDDFFDQLFSSGNWLRFIVRDYPLASDPGQRCDYSNASVHVLAGILARATDMTALEFANQYLFEPLNIHVRAWPRDPQGYYVGYGDMRLRPRDLAKFGYLYLNNGVIDGQQIIPAKWIAESWQDYSVSSYGSIGYFRNIRYGYLWWIADVGDYQVYYAWGHGGQYIVIVPELDLIVVSAADAFVGDFSADSWEMEKGIMDLIGELIASIDPH